MKSIISKQFDDWLALQDSKTQKGVTFSLKVLSGSMLPSLVPGESIRIRRADWKRCHRGDIIVYKLDRNLIAHRLLFRLKIGNWNVVLQKGDLIPLGHWIPAESIVGVVTQTEGEKGKLIDFRSTIEKKRSRKMANRQLLRDLVNRSKYLVKIMKNIMYGENSK